MASRHPRHVALAALFAGLLAAGAGWEAAIVAACVAACAVAAAGGSARLALVCAALLAAGAGIGAARIAAIDRSELGNLMGRSVEARGYVVKRERPTPSARRFRVLLKEAGRNSDLDETVLVRVRRGVALPTLAIGDEVVVGGRLERPVNRAGSSFDYAGYLRRNGVHAVLYGDSVRATGSRRGGLAGLVDGLRRRAEAGVGRGLSPPMAALARGMVLGEDERITDAMSDDFKASGLAHLLAVSGQTVTLLALLALPAFAALGLGRRARLVAVLVLITLYVPLTGAGPSIMRAGAMGAAGTVAALAGRPASRWYALLLAGVFTLLVDPRAWLDPGWQLSFAAVAGIFLLVRPLTRVLHRLPGPLAAAVAVTTAATLATAPLMAFHFERVSVVSLFANLLALPAVAPIMWAGMVSATLAQAWVAPAALVNAIAGYCLGYLSAVASWTAGLPSAVLPVRVGSPVVLGLAYAVPLLGWLLLRTSRGRSARRVTVLAGAAALALAAWAPWSAGVAAPDRFTVSFLDVGQGDAILLQTPAGGSVLVDGGPPESGVVAKLRARGVGRIDLAVLTHAQLDHEGGLDAVLRSFHVGALLDGGEGDRGALHRRIAARANRAGTQVIPPWRGQALRIDRLRIRVLNPRESSVATGAGDPNERAIVLLASYDGLDVLLTADAESDVTLGLPLPRIEVLKVAHHGSADEGLPELLDRTRPDVAVIEVGAGNPFGHPTPEAIAALGRAVPVVRRTDRDGDVTVSYDGNAAAISTSK